jgi:hypothetical protein
MPVKLTADAQPQMPLQPPPQPRHPHLDSQPTHRFLSIGTLRLYPLTIDTKPLFDHYVATQQFVSADLSFANNFIWLTHMSAFYQVVEECLCLFSLSGERLNMLLPPIGASGQQTAALEQCFAAMEAYNGPSHEGLIDFVQGDWAVLLQHDSRWRLEPHHPDYLYRTGDLIELRGNSYKSKRGEINQFLRHYPQATIESLDPARHGAGVRELLHHWLRARLQHAEGEELADLLASTELERQGIERALRHFGPLGLSGLCLLIDGRIEGFTFGERVNPRVASILVEKTNFAISGAAQFLFREFCKHFSDCDFINVGDDLGLENMRRVKMSYRPVMFAEKYTLRRLSAAESPASSGLSDLGDRSEHGREQG